MGPNRIMSMLRERKGTTRGHSQSSHNGSTIASSATRNNSPCRSDDNSSGGCADLPEEIWHHIHSLMPIREAARVACCVSHVFLSSWESHPSLTLTEETMRSKDNIHKWKGGSSDEKDRREYNRNIDRILANRRGPGMKTFRLHVYGPYNTKSYIRLDSWLRIAITPVLEQLTLFQLIGKSEYNFPCSLLSHGRGNTIRHLHLNNCALRPTVNLSLRCLTELYLHSVRVTGDELWRLLSNSSALENLILIHCEGITRLEIPRQLQRLRCLEVFECCGLEAIENKAPNLYSFNFTGHEIQLSLGESLQVKILRLTRRCVISYAIDKLASTVPNLETLTLLSSREIVDAPIVPGKFLRLKVLSINIQSWSFGRDYDFLSLVSFLDASPSLETFGLFVSVQSNYDWIVGDPSTLRRMPGCHHDKLKTVSITDFCRQKSLVELTRHILDIATSLKDLTLTAVDAKHRFYGHSSARECPTLDKEYIKDLWESMRAVKTYIEGKVPSTVEFKVYGPCSQCHAL